MYFGNTDVVMMRLKTTSEQQIQLYAICTSVRYCKTLNPHFRGAVFGGSHPCSRLEPVTELLVNLKTRVR